ncbi:MAG: MBL fold metallo-hydrolase [Candidatus Marinimicrobia bacterium]|nr:MBL fold metallo-hydrolase [Candidatus Neomarinimicrobiota bacterium]
MELNILGTASQLPTETRNHGGYFLRWEDQAILFDPGEGIQRQFILGGLSVPSVRIICLSHFHGDHCLGLPGVIQRLALARVPYPIMLIYPQEGEAYLTKLLSCSEFQNDLILQKIPIVKEGVIAQAGKLHIEAVALQHRIPTYGYRLVKPKGYRFDKEKLQALEISGKSVGILQKNGKLQTPKGIVTQDHVSKEVPPQIFAYVADTAPGNHLKTLMKDADLVLCETTYLKDDAELALQYKHLTTKYAATAAKENEVKYLIATHFSERYGDTNVIEKELRDIFPRSYAAHDFLRYTLEFKTGKLTIETIRKNDE